jgi:flagellar biosynthesis/type III secretory pathway chaperone
MSHQAAASLLAPFATAVADTLRHLEALQPLLEREHEALHGREPQTLNAVIREKLEVLGRLEAAMRGIETLLQRAGLRGGGAGGDALLERLPHPDELGEQWRRLKTRAAEVDRLNARNGSLTKQAQRSTRTALSILTGRQTTDPSYDRRGRDQGGLTGYSLGEA